MGRRHSFKSANRAIKDPAGRKWQVSPALRNLFAASSITAIIVATPSLSHAQALPAGCTDGGNDIAENGETVTCVVAAPTVIGGISTNVDDITVNVGDASTATTINSGGVAGVNIYGGSGNQTLNIYNAGSSVTGSSYGVYLYQQAGPGNVTITSAGAITGNGSSGIFAYGGGDGNVDISVLDVFGDDDGISSFNQTGETTITIAAGGNVVSDSVTSSAIDARSSGASAHITIQGTSTSDVYSQGYGMRLITDGGDITVQDLGSVTALAQGGIFAQSKDGAITVSGVDTILSNGGNGITAISGRGDITISVNNVYAYGGRVIDANNSSTSMGDVSFTATGILEAQGDGIALNNNGYGNLYVNFVGVTSNSGDGVFVRSEENSDLAVINSTGTINADREGVEIISRAQTSTTISVNDVNAGNEGIEADIRDNGGDLIINVNGNIVAAGEEGIEADNQGIGDTTITLGAGSSVTSQAEQGIEAFVTNASSNITVQGSSGDITGATDGLAVTTAGGDILVQNLDSVTGQAGDGIVLLSNGGAITVQNIDTIDANGGAFDGIDAISGGGAILIDNVGSVGGVNASGIGGDGIYANSEGGAGGITINATGNIDGQSIGVKAYNDTGGSINITTSSITSNDTAIFAEGDTGNVDVNITATGMLYSADGTVYGYNDGTGSTTISVADVIAANGDGVWGETGATTTGDLTISSTGAVEASGLALRAINEGSGNTIINVVNAYGDTDLSGSGGGISANSSAISGALSITASGTVSGGGTGIYALQSGAGGLTINTVDVASTNGVGIESVNLGVGALSITTADVTSASTDGIFAYNGAASTSDVSVDSSAGSINSADYGIFVRNSGSGDLSITTADVTSSTAGAGVFGSSSGRDLSIDTTAGTVTSERIGVGGYNYLGATGALSIAVGEVTGGYDGVFARNSGTDLIVTSTGLVTGGDQGIDAQNAGTGALSITAVDVTGLGDDAIDVVNSPYGTTLSVETTGLIDGADDGIDATNFGTVLSITTAGSVTGGQSGIEAYNYGSGTTTITVSGAVSGTTELGIYTVTENGARITVASGGSVTGAMGAIHTDAASAPGDPSDDRVTLAAGGSIDGDVLLDAGADSFNDQGGSFTNVLGGDGIDTAIFDNAIHDVTGDGSNVNAIQEVEIFNFNSGITGLAGTHTDVTETNIAAGATLNARDGAQLSGVLTNNGTLNIGNSPGTFTVNGDFVQTATGVLPIEVGPGPENDLLIVTGDVSLAGTIDVMVMESSNPGTTTRTIIDGGTGLNGNFDSVVGVNSGLLISNQLSSDATTFDVSLTTTVNYADSISGLTGDQTVVGNTLISELATPTIDPSLLGLINAVGAIPDLDLLARTLDELQPTALDAGLKFMGQSQERFAERVLGQALPETDGYQAWGGLEVYGIDQSGGSDHIGFDGTALSFAAGISGVDAGPIMLGFAGGYTQFDGNGDGLVDDDVEVSLLQLGASIGTELGFGPVRGSLSSVMSYTTGENEIVMNLTEPATGIAVRQAGDADVSSFDWIARYMIYGNQDKDWVIKPYVMAGFNAYEQDAVDIGTGGATALNVDGIDNGRWQIGGGGVLDHQLNNKSRLTAGAAVIQYFGDTENVFTSRFAAASAGSSEFTTTGKEVATQVQLDGAFMHRLNNGMMVSVGGFGELGDLNLYGVNLKLAKPF